MEEGEFELFELLFEGEVFFEVFIVDSLRNIGEKLVLADELKEFVELVLVVDAHEKLGEALFKGLEDAL